VSSWTERLRSGQRAGGPQTTITVFAHWNEAPGRDQIDFTHMDLTPAGSGVMVAAGAGLIGVSLIYLVLTGDLLLGAFLSGAVLSSAALTLAAVVGAGFIVAFLVARSSPAGSRPVGGPRWLLLARRSHASESIDWYLDDRPPTLACPAKSFR
jgi:hypothetical protein